MGLQAKNWGKRLVRMLVLTAVGALGVSHAHGQTTASWVNPVDGSWTDPTMWSTNPVFPNNGNPAGSTYNAVVNATGSPYTISLGSTVTLSGLHLNSPDATLIQTSVQMLTLAGAGTISAGTYQFQGGSLSGAGNLYIGGTMHWSKGSILSTGGGSIQIHSGGVLNVAPGEFRSISRPLFNAGTVNFMDDMSYGLSNTIFNNSGYINVGTTEFAFTGNGPALTNSGTIVSMGTATSLGTLTLVNSGTILVNSGSLQIGTSTHNTGAYIGGPSTMSFSGTHTINGTLTLAGSNIQVGTSSNLAGPGNIVISGGLHWLGGGFGGTGTTLVNPGVTVNISSLSVFRSLSRTLANSGTVNFNLGGSSLSLSSATILNSGYVNFPVATSTTKLPFSSSGGLSLFNNTGTVTSGAGTLNLSTAGLIVRNSGTILTGAGTLILDTVVHEPGSYFGGTGAVILNNNGGSQTFTSTPTFDNNLTLLNNGSLTGAGDLVVSKTFQFTRGLITGTGSVIVNAGATFNFGGSSLSKTLSRTLVNSGTINIPSGSPSILLSNGRIDNHGYLNVGSIANQYDIEPGVGTGLITNTGTISSAFSVLFGSVPFINSGTISGTGTIFLAGTSVTHETGSWIGGSTIGLNFSPTHAQTLNGTLTLAGNHSHLFNGSIVGDGNLVIQRTFHWSHGSMSGQGTVIVNPGGTLDISSSSQARLLQRPLNNSGTMNMIGGNATLALSSTSITNSGVMNLSSGSSALLIPFNNSTGTNSISNTGKINALSGAVAITVPLTNSGAIAINPGSSLGAVEPFLNTGSIDLNGALIVDYTAESPLSALVGQIGTNIISSTASSDPSKRIGYAEASALGVTTFADLPVDSTAALLALTFGGDADLDGDVDVADLGRLASSWQSTSDWVGGDFDYSGFVDVADLGLLASNWQAGVDAPLTPTDGHPWALAEALSSLGLPDVNVPEPGALGLLVVPVVLKCHRRRSRQRC